MSAASQLKSLPISDLKRAAEQTRVTTFSVGLDTGHRAVVWKLVFQNGRVATFLLAPAVAVHAAKSIRRAAREHKWRVAADDWPENAPDIVAADWTGASNPTMGTIIAARVDSFSDGVIVALAGGTDLVQAIQLSAALALPLAQLHWDAIGNGSLRDIDDETPPNLRET